MLALIWSGKKRLLLGILPLFVLAAHVVFAEAQSPSPLSNPLGGTQIWWTLGTILLLFVIVGGGLYYNPSTGNRWKMRQYPINSSQHADRFIKWFNDCDVMFKEDNLAPTPSFYRLLREYNE